MVPSGWKGQGEEGREDATPKRDKAHSKIAGPFQGDKRLLLECMVNQGRALQEEQLALETPTAALPVNALHTKASATPGPDAGLCSLHPRTGAH